MNIENLLKLRFEVINDYPNSSYKVNDILIKHKASALFYTENDKLFRHAYTIDMIEKYPHLFKKLQWWEKRKEEEMPIYIKSATKVVKPKWELIEWKGNKYWRANDADAAKYGLGVHFNLELFTPATEEEYLSFINKA